MESLEIESKRLQDLRARQAAVTASIAKSRGVIAKCIREAGEACVANVVDPEIHTAKATEMTCKKLAAQRAEAQAEIDKLSSEAEALATAIPRIEADLVPLQHGVRLERQAALREQYRALCARLLEAAEELAETNREARDAFESAQREFRADELCAGQDVVMRGAGLRAVHDGAWLSFPGQPTRGHFFAERVYDFDPRLVPEGHPVAILRNHQEAFWQKERERHQKEQSARVAASGVTPETFRPATLPERLSGQWTPEKGAVYHPLSETGKALDLGLIKRAS